MGQVNVDYDPDEPHDNAPNTGKIKAEYDDLTSKLIALGADNIQTTVMP